MKTAIIRCNGARDGTEESVIQNWAAEYAKRLVEEEKAQREAADDALNNKIDNHAAQRATDTHFSHVALSDATDSVLNAKTGQTAATPYAVKQVNDALNRKINDHAAQRATDVKFSHVALSDSPNSALNALNGHTAATPYALYVEEKSRKDADDLQQEKINKLQVQAEELRDADRVLQENIDIETKRREEGDYRLKEWIEDEKSRRIETDNALRADVTALQKLSHTHSNKDVLDGITQKRVDIWDGIEDQVTREQFNLLKMYLEDICFGFNDEFGRVWGVMGLTVYDGGIFGMLQNDIALDGGYFTDTQTGIVDCGNFNPYKISSGTGGGTAADIVDGGIY